MLLPALSLIMFLLSLLAVVRPLHYTLWMLSVPVKEWGHWFALLCLPLVWLGLASGGTEAYLAVAAAMLFLVPLVTARRAARQLPAAFAAAFGPAAVPAPGDRAAPLVWRDLLLGVRKPRLQTRTITYADPGDGRPLRMDITRPTVSGPAPVVLVIHAGSWRSGDRTQLPDLNGYLAGRGFLTAAMDYRLSPVHRFPAAVEDVKAAIAYIKQHAQELGADPERMVLLGRSAGGQVAVLAAYTAGDPAIRGVVSFYGPFDLAWGYRVRSRIMNFREVLDGYLGPGGPEVAPEAYRSASPLSFAGRNSPPTLMVQGGADMMVSPKHNTKLSALLKEAGRPHLIVEVPLSTHGSDFAFSGPFGQISTYAVERFLRHVIG
ncbi:MAG TPA: alpha/beta hydrolase [Symbiobacteriaceae bacterium]|nr:alpha/beta hydrolase [Symbiobacteriaceae bacterium]